MFYNIISIVYLSVTALVSRKHVLSPKIIDNAQCTYYIIHAPTGNSRPNHQIQILTELWLTYGLSQHYSYL